MPTKIEWTQREGTTGETWSPITGCDPDDGYQSEACPHCWARRMSKRLAGRFGYFDESPFQITQHPDRYDEPLHWKKPRTVFVCSMGDLFHEQVPWLWIERVFQTMTEARQHTYLLLTKRPHHMREFVTKCYPGLDQCCPHIWLGITAENQKRADERIPILLQIPAAVRFVSVEPMLGPIDLGRACPCGYYCDESVGHVDHSFWTPGIKPDIDWIICGGESGPGARPMQHEWARSLRDQCVNAGASFFFKQWGEWAPVWDSKVSGTGYTMMHVGRRNAGRLLNGREWNQYPGAAQ